MAGLCETTIRVGAALEQQLRRILLAEAGSEVQCREAVGRRGRGEARVCVEQLLEPARAPDRRGVVDVERGIGVEIWSTRSAFLL